MTGCIFHPAIDVSRMFSDLARKKSESAVTAVARCLQYVGLTPNSVTLIGVGFMFAIGYVISLGYLATGGVLIVLAGAFDALDGSLARLTNNVTKFGGFLDSVTDRYAEFAVFGGILHYLLSKSVVSITSNPSSIPSADVYHHVYVVILALFGSVMVSYNRARAEGLGFECKGGWFSRFERLVVLVGGLVLTRVWGDQALYVMLYIMAFFTNITAVQRIMLVYELDNTNLQNKTPASTSTSASAANHSSKNNSEARSSSRKSSRK